MAHKDTAKGYFETGDYPTQTQFHWVFDVLRWIDVKIGLSDLAQEVIDLLGRARPERVSLTVSNNTIDMPAEYRLVNLAIKNPSAFDLVFYANYPAFEPPAPGDNWIEIEVPAGKHVDVTINKTFWTATSISFNEQSGEDFSATPVIMLIDRK